MGVFPDRHEIFEWRWDLKKLARKAHPWKSQQWISSGFDEPQAQKIRSSAFRLAQAQSSAGSLDWLRRLHRSHAPGRGPFSTCMHRADAASASYTEIALSSHNPNMRYHAAAPYRAFKPRCGKLRIQPARSRLGAIDQVKFTSPAPIPTTHIPSNCQNYFGQ
jgi:hypothetical protein